MKPLQNPGFNEGQKSELTTQDVRFTRKGDTVYAFVMGAPTDAVRISSLGTKAYLLDSRIGSITLLGSDETPKWSQTDEALVIEAPATIPNEIAVVFKITPRR